MDSWFDEAQASARPGAVMCLVGSKSDKEDSRTVQTKEAQALADSRGAGYWEVSAKSRRNVKQPFVEVVENIVRSPNLLAAPGVRGSGVVALDQKGGGGSWCYC